MPTAPIDPAASKCSPRHAPPRAFTLIELLIVVAIIAILAAIAVPNFLEAQVRAKTARVKNDMRTLSIALEAYRVDFNAYAMGNTFGVAASRPGYVPADPRVFENLSTPIAYITNALPQDPFSAKKRSGSIISGNGKLTAAQTNLATWTDTPALGAPDYFLYRTYLYISTTADGRSDTGITRVSNDDSSRNLNPDSYIINSASPMEAYVNAGGVIANSTRDLAVDYIYDPTNGSVSFGQIWRAGGAPANQNNLFGAINQQN